MQAKTVAAPVLRGTGWAPGLRNHGILLARLLLLLLRVPCLLPVVCSCLLDPIGPVVLPVEGLVGVQVLLCTAQAHSAAGHTAHEHSTA